MQKLDDMDKAAWERVEEQEGARIQIWHTKTRNIQEEIPARCARRSYERPVQRNKNLIYGEELQHGGAHMRAVRGIERRNFIPF